jgi:hypothetical protein
MELFFLCKSAADITLLTDGQQTVVTRAIPEKPEINSREVRPWAGGRGKRRVGL